MKYSRTWLRRSTSFHLQSTYPESATYHTIQAHSSSTSYLKEFLSHHTANIFQPILPSPTPRHSTSHSHPTHPIHLPPRPIDRMHHLQPLLHKQPRALRIVPIRPTPLHQVPSPLHLIPLEEFKGTYQVLLRVLEYFPRT